MVGESGILFLGVGLIAAYLLLAGLAAEHKGRSPFLWILLTSTPLVGTALLFKLALVDCLRSNCRRSNEFHLLPGVMPAVMLPYSVYSTFFYTSATLKSVLEFLLVWTSMPFGLLVIYSPWILTLNDSSNILPRIALMLLAQSILVWFTAEHKARRGWVWILMTLSPVSWVALIGISTNSCLDPGCDSRARHIWYGLLPFSPLTVSVAGNMAEWFASIPSLF